jgi:hypothetical protein
MFFVLAEDDLLAINRGHPMLVTLHAFAGDALTARHAAGPLLLCSPERFEGRHIVLPATPFTIVRRLISGDPR